MKVILILALCALVVAHEGHDHYEDAGHVCQHDDIVREELRRDPDYYNRMRETGVKQNYREGDLAAFAKVHSERVEAAKAGKPISVSARGLTGTSQIRVTLDFSSFSTADSRTCATIGQVVNVGAATNTPCSATVANDCTITCGAEHILTQDAINFIKLQLVADAEKYLEEALSVVPISGNLAVTGADDGTNTNTRVCGFSSKGYVPIPQSLQTNGSPDTDLLLFVTGRPTVGSLLAYAGSCQADGTTQRPVVGQINIAPNAIYGKMANTFAYQSFLGVAVHEITHVLGFTVSQFTKSQDNDNLNTGQSGFVVPGVTYTNQLASNVLSKLTIGSPAYPMQYGLQTPIMLARAKAYYGNSDSACSSLSAVPIENGGGAGTQFSHWDKRIIGDELMGGSTSTLPKYSEFTLAALEDSGWYVANYGIDMGQGLNIQLFSYGRDQSASPTCEFVTSRCSQQTWSGKNYYCTQNLLAACTTDRAARGYCAIQTWPMELPVSQQYFAGQPTMGGSDFLADYCPQVIAYSNGWCTDPTNASPSDDAAAGQFFTGASGCFDSSVQAQGRTTSGALAWCYPRGCSGSTLFVNVGRDWVQCSAGASFAVPDFPTGTFTCPEADYITRTCSSIIGTGTPAGPGALSCSATDFNAAGGATITISGTGLEKVVYADVAGVPCSISTVTGSTVVCTTQAFQGVTKGGTAAACTVIDSYNRMAQTAATVNVPPSNSASAIQFSAVTMLVALIVCVLFF